MTLSENERDFLLGLARKKISSTVNNHPFKSPTLFSESLKQNCGAFVTLTRKGHLRGCIGYVTGVKPLQQAVEEMATAAAFEDPRFPPVQEKELNDLQIEISVLSPLKKITDINEITVGTHGLIISNGYRQGLLLPQVAVEYNWDRKTFLEETCHKAGLHSHAWQEDSTEIEIFSAVIFSERS
ncbi:MAG: AmmeMemoRadiSam system protein A [Calditrichales bacterium]|nr:MAG: AmmeMemoRadiSam system protein A [Calditrichales bacterium]